MGQHDVTRPAQRAGLCLCTVVFCEIAPHILRIPTYIFPEGLDILNREGLLWQATLRLTKGFLWQANLRQSSSKPPEKDLTPALCPPIVAEGSFITVNQQHKSDTNYRLIFIQPV